MDQIGEWRPVEPPATPAASAAANDKPADANAQSGVWRIAVAAALGAAVLGAAGVALWATTPQPQLFLGAADEASVAIEQPGGSSAPGISTGGPAALEEILVDVEGAVAQPGLHRLPPGGRVGDAIAAAGGYSPQVDIRAAAERLNLAERLTDGAKIHVPARGEAALAATPAGGGSVTGSSSDATPPPAGNGPIEINTASQAQLETLPGIGPVTAGKIISARDEAPFASVDELLGRKVVGPATFEKIRQLVTVGL